MQYVKEFAKASFLGAAVIYLLMMAVAIALAPAVGKELLYVDLVWVLVISDFCGLLCGLVAVLTMYKEKRLGPGVEGVSIKVPSPSRQEVLGESAVYQFRLTRDAKIVFDVSATSEKELLEKMPEEYREIYKSKMFEDVRAQMIKDTLEEEVN